MDWWKKRHTVIQTNLQAKDAPRIDPQRLAGQIEELGAQTLVFNVGGIYGWYRSDVPYHHVNEFLPKDRDLLGEVIKACHARSIRFVGRFDFTRAEDATYQAHPEWFALDSAGKPIVTGAMRPGEWSLLYNICHSSQYYNQKVAVPVLTEALSRYPLDGVFFNGVYVTRCHCDICKEKYLTMFGAELPDDDNDADPAWRSRQIAEYMCNFRAAVDAGRPGTPLILYHWPEMGDYIEEDLAEMICDESQNVLSRGLEALSDDWTPSLKMKLLRLETSAPPYGIIHSSPGMDWRHTGLPPAEYRFWLSQVPAGGGVLWHSLTGVPDTIADKRILNCVKAVDADIIRMLPAMEGVRPVEDILLLFDRARPPKGWLRALYERQILFGLAFPRSAAPDIFRYRAVLLPEGFPVDEALAGALTEYVKNGGYLLIEGGHPELNAVRGVAPGQKRGEYMFSSYLAPEPSWMGLDAYGLVDVPLLPFRGVVSRMQLEDARALATLVPSFAPLDAVGAPPERASILTRHTDIPLVFERTCMKGKVVSLSFSLDHLIANFALAEHLQLADALFDRVLPTRQLRVQPHNPGLIATLFEGERGRTLHIVNGTGRRPLAACTPLYGIVITVAAPGAGMVVDMAKGAELPFDAADGEVRFTVDRLDTWNTYWIRNS